MTDKPFTLHWHNGFEDAYYGRVYDPPLDRTCAAAYLDGFGRGHDANVRKRTRALTDQRA